LLACHCVEIPFAFDNLPNWPDAPMLKNADGAEVSGLAQAMHAAWVAFMRTGNPNHGGLPPWAPYESAERITMRFDRAVGPVRDLAGVSWRRPWPAP
jgi:para-nitrobenzyl esterase